MHHRDRPAVLATLRHATFVFLVLCLGAIIGPASPALAQCPGAGDCCVANGTPGCDDPVCCELICGFDPFCCNNSWDVTCAAAAGASCTVCSGPANDDCVNAQWITGGDTLIFNELGATLDGPGVTCDDPFSDIWYRTIAPWNGVGQVTLCNAFQPLSVAVYSGSQCPTVDDSEVFCGCGLCDICSTPGQFAMVAGQEYIIRIGGATHAHQATLGLTFLEPGDLDGSGVVGVTDLLVMLASWGPCPPPCPPACIADIDGDCQVGVLDLLALLANWG